MLELNIVSDKTRKEIKLNNIYLSLQTFFYVLVILISAYSISMLFLYTVIDKHFQITSIQASGGSPESKNIYKNVDDTNNTILNIEKIQSDMIYWSEFLVFLTKNMDNDITIYTINISADKSFSLSGKASTREGLIKLKENLEKSPYLTAINFPISNLLEKENIAFQIKANFKSYEF